MKRIILLIAAFAATLGSSAVLLGTPSALAASTPSVTTGAASFVNPTSAAVVGTVNLNGATLATSTALTPNCFFEYGTGTTLSATSSTQACVTSPTATGTSTVAAALTGLTAGTTYYYQLVINTGGVLGLIATSTDGTPEMSFTTPTASTPPTAAVAPATAVTGAGATLNGTVNPNNWSITSCSFSYTPSGGTASTASCAAPLPTGATAQAVSAAATGLAQGQAYTYTLTIGYGSGTAATTVTSTGSSSFTTPAASVATPTQLASTTATLIGSVNPEGQTVTSCTFYYGSSGGTLQNAPCTPAASAITGTTATAISANVTGLTAKTAYFETVVLVTPEGSTAAALGDFTTPATAAPPTATTSPATAITSTTATLHATVNAAGQGVRACEFEYGVNPLTASSTPGDDQGQTQVCSSSPSTSGNQSVTLNLRGLAPKTTYYYRVLFQTYGGYVISTADSFTTAASKTVNTAKPRLRIASAAINQKAGTAKFKVSRSGSVRATRGYQCSLVTVSHGKARSPRYATCPSFKTYAKLKAGTYVFSVRGANANGFGPAVSRRFTI